MARVDVSRVTCPWVHDDGRIIKVICDLGLYKGHPSRYQCQYLCNYGKGISVKGEEVTVDVRDKKKFVGTRAETTSKEVPISIRGNKLTFDIGDDRWHRVIELSQAIDRQEDYLSSHADIEKEELEARETQKKLFTKAFGFANATHKLVSQGKVSEEVADFRLTVCTGKTADGTVVQPACNRYKDEKDGVRGSGHCKACGCPDWPGSKMDNPGNKVFPGKVWYPIACPLYKFGEVPGRRLAKKLASGEIQKPCVCGKCGLPKKIV